MANYVNRVTLDIDGQEEKNFKAITPGEEDHRSQVNLMNSTGTSKKLARYSFTLDYVVPEVGARDWSEVEDATCKYEYENGEGYTYRRCSVSNVGEATIDGEGEVVQTISFIAEDKKPN